MSTGDAHDRPPRRPDGPARRRRSSWLVPALVAAAVLAVIAGVVAWQPWASDEAGTPMAPGGGAGSAGSGGGGGPVPADPIPATGYHVRDATHLAIVYTNGVPECYGRAGTPLVEETADAVTVTIPRVRVAPEKGRVCIDIALVDSVDVTLDAPLDGRTVRDGSRGGAVLPPQALPGDDRT